VDCSGAGPGISDALHAARCGGRLVQIGLAGKEVTVPFDLICFKELTVTSGFASTPVSWQRALALLERDAIDLPRLVTEVVALRDFRQAFDDTRAGAGVKYVMDPRSA
jgi:L-iditol 2-dehydrogenase